MFSILGLVDSPFWPDSTCLVAHSEMLASEGVVTEILGASLVMTLSQSTKINGWSMTSSLAAGKQVLQCISCFCTCYLRNGRKD